MRLYVKPHESWQQTFNFTLRCFVALAGIFAVHRLFTFPYLKASPNVNWLTPLQFFITGLGSDLWVAWLFTAVFSLVALLLSPTGRCWFYVAVTLLLLGLLGAHQSYVEFFGFQMLPYHFTYFIDGAFIKANGNSIFFNPRVWLTFGIGSFVAVAASYLKWPPRDTSPKTLPKLWPKALVLIGVTLMMLGMHSANIHYRVQLMLDEGLRLNVAERLYESLMEQSIPDQLSESEWQLLSQTLGRAVPFPSDRSEEANHLYDLLLHTPTDAELSPFGKALHDALQKRRATGRPLHIMIALMESLRAGDIAALTNAPTSITPNLDRVIKGDSLVWKKAIATGNVTRGGQEASLCGHLSAMTTSMMRKRPQLKLNCLPKILAQHPIPKTLTYWLHGGEGEFDGQKAFWDSQNMGLTMARRDFPDNLPANDWGMGDISFFHAAWERLLQSFAQNTPTQSFGMLLSVSNHPPWQLPPDTPEFLRKEASTLSQPSYQTTLYADFALGQWLKAVSESILWPDTMIIILGDHGQQESPVFGSETLEPQGQAVLAHIPLIITGGLIAELKNELPNFATERISDAWVSQADLAASLALWLGAKAAFFGEPLYSTRRAPVMSLSGDKIWLAEKADARPPREFLHAAAENDPHRFEVTYTRAFLRLISL